MITQYKGKNRRIHLSLLFLLTFCFPTKAHALQMEYYTYGGFEPIVSAFQKLSLIFSDNEYKTLFFTVVVLGIFFGALFVYIKIFSGGRVAVLSWAVPIMLGVLIYLALVIPKGTLYIYDPVLNKNQAVGSIPDGIVLVAGVLNLIERGVVEIISTANDPQSYKLSAGGIGFNMLLHASGGPKKLNDQYINESMTKYIKDCLFFELMKPGTPLSKNDIVLNSTDLRNEFSVATNDAIYTVWYDENNKTGVTMTCTDAWNKLNAYLSNDSNFEDSAKIACALGHLNSEDPVQLNVCKNLIHDFVNYTSGGISVSASGYIRQAYMAKHLNDTLTGSSPDTAMMELANRNIMTSGIGMGVIANEWFPIIRAVVTSVMLGLIPVIVIFIPTPLVGRATGLIAGFFIWLTAWGITDAVTHEAATSYGYKVFENIRQANIALGAMVHTPDASMKALAMFGAVRSAGILMATVLTGMLVKFGGHALSKMATGFSGTITSQGSDAAIKTQTPEGLNKKLESLEIPVLASTQRWDWNRRHESKSNLRGQQIGSGAGFGGMDKAYDTGYQNTSMGVASTKGKYNALGGNMSLKEHSSYNQEKQSVHSAIAIGSEVQSYAERNRVSEDQAWEEWSKTGIADRSATLDIFGNEQNYREFLKANKTLSKGQVQGVIKAAQAGGFKLENYAEQKAFVDNLQKTGMLSAYSEGKVTNDDLQLIGSTGILTQKGAAQARQNISETTGMSVDQVEDYLGTWKGVSEYARFSQVEKAAKDAGIKNQLKTAMAVQGGSVTMALTNRQAKNSFGETAQAGRYTVSRSAEGDVVAFHSETGGRFNVMGFTKHVETVIGPHNIKGKREEYREAGFHNVSDSRMMNLSRGNMIASEVYDQKGNLIQVSLSRKGEMIAMDSVRDEVGGVKTIGRDSSLHIRTSEGDRFVVIGGKIIQTGDENTIIGITDKGESIIMKGTGDSDNFHEFHTRIDSGRESKMVLEGDRAAEWLEKMKDTNPHVYEKGMELVKEGKVLEMEISALSGSGKVAGMEIETGGTVKFVDMAREDTGTQTKTGDFGSLSFNKPETFSDKTNNRELTISSGSIVKNGPFWEVQGSMKNEVGGTTAVSFRYDDASQSISGFQVQKPSELRPDDAYYAINRSWTEQIVNLNDEQQRRVFVSNLAETVDEWYSKELRTDKSLKGNISLSTKGFESIGKKIFGESFQLPLGINVGGGGSNSVIEKRDEVISTLNWAALSAADQKTGEIDTDIAEQRMKYVTDAYIAHNQQKDIPDMPSYGHLNEAEKAQLSNNQFEGKVKKFFQESEINKKLRDGNK